jgi:hypothetical protein
VGADAVLLRYTRVGADAVLQATRTKPVSANAVLKITRTKTVTADGVLLRGTYLLGDAVLQRTRTRAVLADAICYRITPIKTVGVDAVFQAPVRVGVDFVARSVPVCYADAVLMAGTKTQADAILFRPGITVGADAYLLPDDPNVRVTQSSLLVARTSIETTEAQVTATTTEVAIRSTVTAAQAQFTSIVIEVVRPNIRPFAYAYIME